MDLTKLIKTTDFSAIDESDRRDILFASSEVVPFSKTGGLADVSASLPKALAERGHRVSVITPLYGHLDPEALRLSRRLRKLEVPRRGLNQNKLEATVWEGRLEGGVRIFFVQYDDFFDREGGLYGDENGDYEDSAARFSFFGRAVVEFARQFSVPVDVFHCNDWHTALTPIYKEHYYEDEMGDMPVVFTIHNLAFQGQFPAEKFADTGLPKTYDEESQLRQGDVINFMKGGIIHSDVITAVSPTYAEEIRTEEKGVGLHEVLQGRADDLVGILNGADYSVWSPESDRFIPVRYDLDNLNGKRRNKAELQHRLDLAIRPTMPLLGFVGRLTDQKGLDILLPALENLLENIDGPREGFQIALLGEGESRYEERIQQLADSYPDRVGVHIGYSEEMAHYIQAGSDILLVPSQYEPCGLTQLYAMKYGTLPLVHATGGLADTVTDAGDDSSQSTGFVFDDYSVEALQATMERATERYGSYRKWRPLMQHAMQQDFSWGTSATRYDEIYESALAERAADHAAE